MKTTLIPDRTLQAIMSLFDSYHRNPQGYIAGELQKEGRHQKFAHGGIHVKIVWWLQIASIFTFVIPLIVALIAKSSGASDLYQRSVLIAMIGGLAYAAIGVPTCVYWMIGNLVLRSRVDRKQVKRFRHVASLLQAVYGDGTRLLYPGDVGNENVEKCLIEDARAIAADIERKEKLKPEALREDPKHDQRKKLKMLIEAMAQLGLMGTGSIPEPSHVWRRLAALWLKGFCSCEGLPVEIRDEELEKVIKARADLIFSSVFFAVAK